MVRDNKKVLRTGAVYTVARSLRKPFERRPLKPRARGRWKSRAVLPVSRRLTRVPLKIAYLETWIRCSGPNTWSPGWPCTSELLFCRPIRPMADDALGRSARPPRLPFRGPHRRSMGKKITSRFRVCTGRLVDSHALTRCTRARLLWHTTIPYEKHTRAPIRSIMIRYFITTKKARARASVCIAHNTLARGDGDNYYCRRARKQPYFFSQGHLGTPCAKGRDELLVARDRMGVNPRGPLTHTTAHSHTHTHEHTRARAILHNTRLLAGARYSITCLLWLLFYFSFRCSSVGSVRYRLKKKTHICV